MQASNMTEIIYDFLTSRILFGYYVSGDRLPSISYICKIFQVSTLTVRTALAMMREDGYIETQERKIATVIYQPDENTEKKYIHYYLTRKDGIDDICMISGIIFAPIAHLYFQRQDRASIKRIRSVLKSNKWHAAKQITMFYAESMAALNNPLALNLYWEVVRYLRTPYLQQPFNFNEADFQSKNHIRRMLTLTEAGEIDKAIDEMTLFNHDVIQQFLMKLKDKIDSNLENKQIPFRWKIYWEHPQLCYTLAADITDKIYKQAYIQGEFLPACQDMAREYGVSLTTMRRTIKLLNDMKITESLNGVGTRVRLNECAGAPNFTHPQIRKGLSMFLQALQISALTCKNVSVHTLSSLDNDGFQELEKLIQKQNETNMAYMLSETCLQFIGEKSPSPFIREVYGQLYRLLLLGHTLHVFYQSEDNLIFYEAYSEKIQENLRNHKIMEFAALLQELVTLGLTHSGDILVRLGFEEVGLI